MRNAADVFNELSDEEIRDLLLEKGILLENEKGHLSSYYKGFDFYKEIAMEYFHGDFDLKKLIQAIGPEEVRKALL